MSKVIKTLIYNKKNQLLVVYRSETHPYYPHQIDFPGGIVEPGEDLIDAAVREAYEEIGIKLSPKAVTIVARPTSPQMKQYYVATAAFDDSQGITLSWEHERFAWLTREEVLKQIATAKGADPFLEEVRAYIQEAKSER